ncbi:carbonic anhydrase 7-like [Lineus longissimus]|uniref:carbonic anhydrase 7-like n=1 Tax=Lineus longissimus TaxID=88925 RepID=UPI002B4CF576
MFVNCPRLVVLLALHVFSMWAVGPTFAGQRHDYHHEQNRSALPAECNEHWGYKGKCGENVWGIIAPMCSQGTHESPINIDPRSTKYNNSLSTPEFFKGAGNKMHSIVNNGHTAIVHIENEYFVKDAGLPGKYKIAQLHFHWGSDDFKGSEHTIAGKSYPLEVHIVMYNRDKYANFKESIASDDDKAVAVFASFADVSDTNEGTEIFDAISKALKKIKYKDLENHVELEAFPPSNLMPKSRDQYYRYTGSFTTPPCSEIVIWTVFKDTIPISHEQLKDFRQLSDKPKDKTFEQMANNYRITQPLENRAITRSFKAIPEQAEGYQIVGGSGARTLVPMVAMIGWTTLLAMILL